ncbi:hypothetical protein L0F63_003739 [Massospora cicadina]|nr:hypothetical protein L0F63_003739 [Massospora cicadina]
MVEAQGEQKQCWEKEAVKRNHDGASTLKPEPKKAKAADESLRGGSDNVLMWFRTDLRLDDNRALEAALECVRRRSNDGPSYLFALFVLSTGEWREHDASKFKVDFLLRNVQKLQTRLDRFDIPLLVEEAHSLEEIPDVVLRVCQEHRISFVFHNFEYEVNEAKRDSDTKTLLKSNEIQMAGRHDQCGVQPGDITAQSSGKPYVIFTPFKNAWLKAVLVEPKHLKMAKSLPDLKQPALRERIPTIFGRELPRSAEGFELDVEKAKLSRELYPAGEEEAAKRLEEFVAGRIADYGSTRDFPAEPGTSVLSPYLTVGVLSPRQCLSRAKSANKAKYSGGKAGIDAWIVELIWRDFYRHVLVAFPRVSKSLPFKRESRDITWSDNEEHFKAWAEGRTGYPIVDAGMRQLLNSGWMHNRVRMITATFLTKDLLINWQRGEKHFMQHLVDGDLANNNGGWQWAASTGADAQPYFRIFNPTTQSTKFDPRGEYIRKWVPELRSIADEKAIHEPYAHLSQDHFAKLGYPKPIVDHSKQRQVAIDMYAKAYKK